MRQPDRLTHLSKFHYPTACAGCSAVQSAADAEAWNDGEEELTPEAFSRVLEEFLASASAAAVFENGEEIFHFAGDATSARYSISGEHGKSLLHLWSAERNAVRRVLDA